MGNWYVLHLASCILCSLRDLASNVPSKLNCFCLPPSRLLRPHLELKASLEEALRNELKNFQRKSYTFLLRRPFLCLFFLLLLLVPFVNSLLLLAFGGCYHRNFFFLSR